MLIVNKSKPKLKTFDENQIYIDAGFYDRDNYLLALSEQFSLPLDYVKDVAEILTKSEDFDKLPAILSCFPDII